MVYLKFIFSLCIWLWLNVSKKEEMMDLCNFLFLTLHASALCPYVFSSYPGKSIFV